MLYMNVTLCAKKYALYKYIFRDFFFESILLTEVQTRIYKIFSSHLPIMYTADNQWGRSKQFCQWVGGCLRNKNSKAVY